MMDNVLLVGATGFLGQHLKEQYNPVCSTLRFSTHWKEWQTSYPEIETVWLVARSCRKQSPRRDWRTIAEETSGVATICTAFPKAHIVYTSTKVVYGITDNIVKAITRQEIGKHFVQAKENFYNRTVDLPLGKQEDVNTDNLQTEHQIYAHTKLCGEHIVRKQPHTIFRIWDII